MKLRMSIFARAFLAVALTSASFGQVLPDQLAAAGNAGELNKRSTPSGLNSAKKAREVSKLADKRAAAVPFAGGVLAPGGAPPTADPSKGGANPVPPSGEHRPTGQTIPQLG